MDLYARQAQNRRRTFAFLLLFVALFAVLGLGLDVTSYGYLSPEGERLPILTIWALVVSVGLTLSSYFGGEKLVMASLLARPLDESIPEHRQLHNIVTEMALAAGLPQPRVYVIPDPAPNALSTGRDPSHAAIAVTQGALNLLDREETQGVVAHEMAHIANRDTLVMTMVGVLLGGLVMLADWARRGIALSVDRRRRGLLLGLVVIVLSLVAPLLSRLIAMAISRQREYLADVTGAELTRNPIGLAHALEKIGAATTAPLRTATRGTAHMFISDPLRRRATDNPGAVGDLFASHPPLSRRIAVLRSLAHGGPQ